MPERSEIEQIQRDLDQNRRIQMISAAFGIASGILLTVEAKAFGSQIEGWEAVMLGTTFLVTVGTLGLAGLAKIGEGTFTNRLRYLRHEAARYNPRDFHIPTPPSNN